MFFICGMSQGKKLLDYTKTVICALCGGYGRYQVIMTYSYFSIFFIPVIKWNRHYYVQMSCCNTVYELDGEKGKKLSRREPVEIEEQDLTLVQSGRRNEEWYKRQCSRCGYETTEDFEYCPKCGQKF
ncbi:zinc ribbon domain-containing protein [Lacrimispora amygdalina]|uniref:Zinc ribbon domain-containing protein n=1 Tax=Lacrimispora amygdalina TaxID=253257 RepID=A0ABQ5M8L5_9FIRM